MMPDCGAARKAHSAVRSDPPAIIHGNRTAGRDHFRRSYRRIGNEAVGSSHSFS